MDTAITKSSKERRRIARAEASVWIVRLHGSHRSPELEAGFRRWLNQHPENAQEFDRVTAVWEAAPHASTAGLPRVTGWARAPAPRRWALAAMLLLACAAAALWIGLPLLRDPVMVTGIGEQRLVPLADGTRVTLNSDSELKVEYTPDTRRVLLLRGEAFFEVAHNTKRPFIVIAGDNQVTAVGTAFAVRYEPDHIDVTLVEGKVSVTSTTTNAPVPQRDLKITTPGANSPPVARAYVMAAGERLTIAKGAATKVEEPHMEAATAWRRGEVMLDDTPLSEAVAEMNRYNKSALVIDESKIANLKVSGIYHTGDSTGFAQTVANLYSLRVTESGDQIHLSSTSPRP
jgi:transmembrane sensor